MKSARQRQALIVEDSPEIVALLRPEFRYLQLNLDHALSVAVASQKLERQLYDLVILDRMLGDGDGLDLLPAILDHSPEARVLVLSGKGSVGDRVAGLRDGADDYLAKPFTVEEVLARVLALLRRSPLASRKVIELGDVRFVEANKLILFQDKKIELSTRETQFLQMLIHAPQLLVAREELTRLWTMERMPSDATVDSFVRRFRLKLTGTPLKIQTRYNMGYALVVAR